VDSRWADLFHSKNPVNDAPVIAGSGLTPVFSTAPVAVDNGIAVSDVDDTVLESATVSITSNFQSSEDVLLFTNQNGISGTYNPATGVLSLAGSATVAQYQNALASVRYNNTDQSPNTATRQIRFVVNDGQLNSNAYVVNVAVVDVNDPPKIVDGNNNSLDTLRITINEDNTLNRCLNVVDPEGDVVVINTATNITGNGSALSFSGLCFSYTPNLNFAGEETLRITVSDQVNVVFDTLVVIITINPVNDPPVLGGNTSALTYSTSPLVIDNSITVSDVDDVSLTSGEVRISSNFVATEDVLNFSNQNGISGSYNAGTGVLTLTGAATLAQYQAALRSVTYTNTDGTPTVNTRQVRFVVNDGDANSNVHIRSIVITDVNDPPVIVDNNNLRLDTVRLNVAEDTPLNSCVLVIDPDGDLAVIESIQGITNNGVYSSISGLCFTFTPDLNFNGQDTARIIVRDVRNPDSKRDTALIIVTVTPVNDPPVVNGFSLTINENESRAICVDAFIFDIENDPSVFASGVSDHGTSVSNTVNACSVSFLYPPAVNYEGRDTVTIRVCDALNSALCDTALVIIDVLRLNDAPVIEPVDTLFMYEDSVSVDINSVCLELTDDSPSLTYTSVKLYGEGSLTRPATLPDRCFFYEPVLNWNGAAAFVVEVCDNESPSLCARDTVVIIVQPVNDRPDAQNDTLAEIPGNRIATINVLSNDSAIAIPYREFYDIYANDSIDNLTVSRAEPSNGTVIVNNDGTISYLPAMDFKGAAEIRYWIHDSGMLIDSAIVFVEVGPPPFKIYEGVSPNGDGKNDFWRIDGIDAFPNNLVRVFDRFNNLVFETRGYNSESNYWVGQANHGLVRGTLPEGTYFYSISLGDGSALLSGYVILKRE